ncbi:MULTISPECIES: AbrB/MazE/SpoVT family DNA-binding domain-containing protein [Okeania]|uniref:AbrB/MazE/SpoVT family DNA-binding domain-containing protein n=1 Tax=Okeania hirsuta TaxID=1458930 RepID=A0A3N6Q2I8_9CYAN|nr:MULTISPECIES: AbrB/MazE/SpoVT family DNA-binding domain-containing protein [Okeania]NET12040.1 AbrB/MazE/SpoVT family DNA-binding domain-containing protein [Okeania sp. SIO1H6]NES77023.1 AbrB/MazE/SpoVT family DNA-binding domain-containing protein [Okeania sp. SIO1H4]NES92566.1 AbrB/MazE/SpoVT family DNA-binding domain-containing protein [Okeania sp. SIO2B9]NET18518.1 AbrB/MazE/SpoVT family DNA-binding domain-containing protein [Okeania sp. SIO1H5]NET76677.1 AbrB/MazE/SpoVT family DNA-bindi
MVTRKVSIWGNSLGVILPQAIIQEVGLKEGTTVSISTEGNKIILSPTKPKYSLEELLKEATPDMQHDELDWGESMGAESW